ncbi:MAG TPA: hypothetical protein VE244_09175 [Nitrososphaeraceae archaeon]|jgi:hypothetical protein|nr:hypothetical protein [Nitrososphaeraceae archaeon]
MAIVTIVNAFNPILLNLLWHMHDYAYYYSTLSKHQNNRMSDSGCKRLKLIQKDVRLVQKVVRIVSKWVILRYICVSVLFVGI